MIIEVKYGPLFPYTAENFADGAAIAVAEKIVADNASVIRVLFMIPSQFVLPGSTGLLGILPPVPWQQDQR
ncbi:MAG: hypothetical protein HKN15_00780 [Xanthomonadales bacterium]|nr:hypothetical protein [Xanthomonadales bacterium]